MSSFNDAIHKGQQDAVLVFILQMFFTLLNGSKVDDVGKERSVWVDASFLLKFLKLELIDLRYYDFEPL
jgi:hypothetical protein